MQIPDCLKNNMTEFKCGTVKLCMSQDIFHPEIPWLLHAAPFYKHLVHELKQQQ